MTQKFTDVFLGFLFICSICDHLSTIAGIFTSRRDRLLSAHGNAMGLIRYKTVSPAGAPQDDATI